MIYSSTSKGIIKLGGRCVHVKHIKLMIYKLIFIHRRDHSQNLGN